MIHLTKKRQLTVLVFALSCIFFSCTDEKSVISVKSMLNEMVDRDEQSRYPKTDFRSSYKDSLIPWYRRPAQIWDEALPIGNGRLGAMVFAGLV